MFTEQAGEIVNRLSGLGMDPRVANELGAILGKCTQHLRHSGPIDLEYQWPDNANRDRHAALTIDTGDEGTALWIKGGRFLCDGDLVLNGATTVGTARKFTNTTGSTIPAGAVMRLTGVTLIGGVPHATVAQPDSTLHTTYYVNATAVSNGQEGVCYTLKDGAALSIPVLYNGTTPTNGQVWGPKSGQWSLEPNRHHFRILGGAAGGLVYAEQDFKGVVDVTLDGSLSPGTGNSATGSVMTIASSPADSGLNITVYGDYLRTGTTIPSSAVVQCVLSGARWKAFNRACAT